MGIGAILLLVPGRMEGRRPVLGPMAAFATGGGGAVVGVGVQLDRNVLASGVYRTGGLVPPDEREITFYRDGRTATVDRFTDDGLQLSHARHQREARRLADPALVHALRLGQPSDAPDG